MMVARDHQITYDAKWKEEEEASAGGCWMMVSVSFCGWSEERERAN